MTVRDQWAEWLLERRFPDEDRRPTLDYLAGIRDRVLDNATLAKAETLLDIGCGDGLIGFGALDRGASTVVFADISQDLLDTCVAAATELGVVDNCQFLHAPADDLSALADESVDVVTTRSVLIYVADKRAAFAEFHRVLKPGGRVSIFEPVNRFGHRREPGQLWAYHLPGLEAQVERVRAVFKSLQTFDEDPMLNFDERDLVDLADQAGFSTVTLQLHIEVAPPRARPWNSFLAAVPNPKVPSLGAAIEQALDPAEREELTERLRPLVEEGRGRSRSATAYLQATKA